MFVWLLAIVVLASAGCGNVGDMVQNAGQPTAQVASASDQNINDLALEPYDGPKARVAVYTFTDQSAKGRGTGWYNPQIGSGMADMLTDALLQSNRFIVLDRQNLKDVLMEQDLGASGRVQQKTAAAIGQIEGAELLVKGSVTEFEPGSAGASAGGGGFNYFGLPGAIAGGVLGSVRQSHVAMVVQVVDAKTSRLLFSSTVEGNANDFSLGGFLGGFSGHGGGSSGLGVYQKTPMEKAIRIAIVKAVQELSKRTPPVYYRFRDQGVAASVPVSAPAKTEQPAKASTGKALPASVVVSASVANLREAPVNGKIIVQLKQGAKLTVNGEDKDWYNIQTEDGKSGWIAKSLTK